MLVATFRNIARSLNLEGPCSIHSAFNLLERGLSFSDLQEVVDPVNENMGVFAFSPLAGGALTGKYSGGDMRGEELAAARLRKYTGFMSR